MDECRQTASEKIGCVRDGEALQAPISHEKADCAGWGEG